MVEFFEKTERIGRRHERKPKGGRANRGAERTALDFFVENVAI
jgi:hypothetical protein